MIQSAIYPLRTIVGDSLPYLYLTEGGSVAISKLR